MSKASGGGGGGGALAKAEKAYKTAVANYKAALGPAKSYKSGMLEGGGGYSPHSEKIRLLKVAGEKASKKYFDLKFKASKKG